MGNHALPFLEEHPPLIIASHVKCVRTLEEAPQSGKEL